MKFNVKNVNKKLCKNKISDLIIVLFYSQGRRQRINTHSSKYKVKYEDVLLYEMYRFVLTRRNATGYNISHLTLIAHYYIVTTQVRWGLRTAAFTLHWNFLSVMMSFHDNGEVKII